MTPTLSGGGAERVMLNLFHSLGRETVDPVFVAADLTGPLAKQLRPDEDVVDLGVKRIRYVIPKLLKEIRARKPDVVLSTFERLNFALLLAKPFLRRNTKVVIREVNLPSKILASYSPVRRFVYRNLYKRLYKRADRIVAQSEQMREEIIRYAAVDASRVVTIHNPVDVASIARLSESDNPFEEAGADVKNIVAVGRLEHQKGFDILIDAFSLFLRRQPDARLYLAGEGTLRSALQQQAEKLGIADRVRFIGYQDNPYPLMKYADLFVLASRFEGFPNVLLEALACNAKVVAADCPNGPREILSRIEYGLLVQPEDPRSLAEGMLRSLDTEQIGSESYKRALDYDCSVITGKYEKLLLN